MKNTNKNKNGFVLLFTIILVSIIFSIALGLSNIAYKEATFSVSGKSSNEAYYSADSGAECALYWDVGPLGSWFGNQGGPQNPVNTRCAGNFINIATNPATSWTFKLLGLGPRQTGCAWVTVEHITSPIAFNRITSKGYNIGGDALQACELSPFLPGRVERIIEITY